MPLNIDWQQILLHLFNFVILFAILYILLYKPVKQFMDKRIEYYRKLDEEAKQKLADAEEAKARYTQSVLNSEAEFASRREKAHKELEESLAVRKKQAEEETAGMIAEAKKNAEREREKILKEAQCEIADMVTAATEKIVLTHDTSETFDQFLAVAQRGENDD